MWFAALNGSGLAATTYGPNVVVATVGVEGARTAVQIEVTTDYPFGTKLRFNITSSSEPTSGSRAPERREGQATPAFPLLLRIPEWTTIDAMRVTISGATHKLVPDEVCPPHRHKPSPQRHTQVQHLLHSALSSCGHLNFWSLSSSHSCELRSNTETCLVVAVCLLCQRIC